MQFTAVDPCKYEVTLTKRGTIVTLQIANVVCVLVFCILYASRYYDRGAGLMAWTGSLVSFSLYTSVRYPLLPGYRTITRNTVLALGIWGCSLLFLGILLQDNLLIPTGIILIFLLLMLILSYLRVLSRELLYCSLVLRGESRYLADVKRYIMRNCIRNHTGLIDSGYTEEHLRTVNESEWHSLAERGKERSFTQLKGKMPDHREVTFFCLLRGEFRYLGAINSYIVDYLSDGKIQSNDFVCSLEKLHIIRKS